MIGPASSNKYNTNIDEVTDVLSFAMLEETIDEPDFFPKDDEMLGDIIISLETAKKQAKEYGHSVERAICYLAIHGMLHLLGYDHLEEKEKRIMRKKEEEILGSFDIKR